GACFPDVASLLAGASAAVVALAACLRGRRGAGGSGATASTAIVMWQVRLRFGPGRIWARGRYRRMVGPSFTYASATMSEFGSSCSLCSAFAIALASTL